MENIINNLHKLILTNKNIAIIITIITILIIAIAVFVFVWNPKNDFNSTQEILGDINSNETNMSSSSELSDDKIIIYITGEVARPGVYELSENSRIIDAIQVAGGTLESANINSINLAYMLSDGEKIVIPNNDNKNENDLIVYESNQSNNKVNINTANVSDLIRINGIGESTAEKIIEYRNNNGKFKNIDEIKKVSGIGESKFNQIKEYIKTK